MSLLSNAVPARPAGGKTPHKLFFNLNPCSADWRNGASDLFRITVKSDNYPDIYVGGNITKTKGIYANLTFSEWAQISNLELC